MKTIQLLFLLCCLTVGAFAQVPMDVQVRILKAEDARRYDKELETLMTDPNAAVRKRAALAAGRIGKEDALPKLIELLQKDPNNEVRTMAAFAIGEVESINGADAVLAAVRSTKNSPANAGSSELPARLLEAAGKIAAANPKDDRSKQLGAALVDALNSELNKKTDPSVNVIRLGLTAVLRARPPGSEETVRKFLAYSDPNIVADALNTLARLRAKNAGRDARDLLQTNTNAVVRANAARVLGAAEDKDAVDILIKAATSDVDPRVRVSAIRSLTALKDAKAAGPLLDRGEKLLAAYRISRHAHPIESNELLEISGSLGRLLAGTRNERATKFLFDYAELDNGFNADPIIARMRISPGSFASKAKPITNWHQYSTIAQALGEMANLEGGTPAGIKAKESNPEKLRGMVRAFAEPLPKDEEFKAPAAPDFLTAFAAYKTSDLSEVMREALKSDDVFIRTTAAGILADQPVSDENVEALRSAFTDSLATDKRYDDAQMAMLDALYKLDKKASADTFREALNAPDYLVRKKAFEILADKDLETQKTRAAVSDAKAADKDLVLSYDPASGTRLGQVLNTDADYRRALSRKNGQVKAIVTTEKGVFTIDLLPEDAPLAVDNFVKLARANYFNGLEVHRVVPNFVMQDGDPRGDGNGGPGWSVRCEINMVPYERGAVGMALSGKDTGGSQWFVTHSPQPHLDGGYTVFGRVNETGMKVVDNIVRGDKIISIKIVEAVNRPKRKR